jgi:hypothetical protein
MPTRRAIGKKESVLIKLCIVEENESSYLARCGEIAMV